MGLFGNSRVSEGKRLSVVGYRLNPLQKSNIGAGFNRQLTTDNRLKGGFDEPR